MEHILSLSLSLAFTGSRLLVRTVGKQPAVSGGHSLFVSFVRANSRENNVANKHTQKTSSDGLAWPSSGGQLLAVVRSKRK